MCGVKQPCQNDIGLVHHLKFPPGVRILRVQIRMQIKRPAAVCGFKRFRIGPFRQTEEFIALLQGKCARTARHGSTPINAFASCSGSEALKLHSLR